jgi:DNA-binding transcriptional ArsR family regulator
LDELTYSSIAATLNDMPTTIHRVKADFFRTLAHPARIRVLEQLRDGERTVGQLLPIVGIEASHLSQQLGILRRAGVVDTRREGNSVIYRVHDPRIFQLLAVAKEIISSSLSDSADLLRELEDPTLAVDQA